MWGGCSNALNNNKREEKKRKRKREREKEKKKEKKREGERETERLNSLLRRSGKLILPDKNLTTDQKLSKIGILSLHKQLDYNNGVFMYRALTNNAPVYISSLYRAPHSSFRNNH